MPGMRRRAERRTKRVRQRKAADSGMGITPTYWAALQEEVQRRPLARLRLLRRADATLVWDPTRPFPFTPQEAAAAAAAASVAAASGEAPKNIRSSSGSENGADSVAVAGGVVGLWRRTGRGVGRWPCVGPVLPEASASAITHL